MADDDGIQVERHSLVNKCNPPGNAPLQVARTPALWQRVAELSPKYKRHLQAEEGKLKAEFDAVVRMDSLTARQTFLTIADAFYHVIERDINKYFPAEEDQVAFWVGLVTVEKALVSKIGASSIGKRAYHFSDYLVWEFRRGEFELSNDAFKTHGPTVKDDAGFDRRSVAVCAAAGLGRYLLFKGYDWVVEWLDKRLDRYDRAEVQAFRAGMRGGQAPANMAGSVKVPDQLLVEALRSSHYDRIDMFSGPLETLEEQVSRGYVSGRFVAERLKRELHMSRMLTI